MNYCGLNKYDTANGDGVRVSLFVSGCRCACKGCFNPETWNFDYGQPFTKETEDEIIEALKPDYISGLTLTGGHPFEPENEEVLIPFVKHVKELYPNKNIWAWSGKYLGELLDDNDELVKYVDVLVDGPFVEELKDLTLKFRGSSNQSIIDLKSVNKIL